MSDRASELKNIFAGRSVRSARRIFAAPLAWWISFAAMLTMLIFPLLLTDVPPLLDYPNHLARIFVLAGDGDDPALSRMYAPHWSLIPNLGTDIVGLLLSRVLPIHVAGRALVALSVVLPVIGVVLYARALSRSRSYWPLAAGLLGYNALLLLGFMSLQISLGLAFIAATIWHAGRKHRRWANVLAVAVLAVAVFFCHIIGLVFLAVLLCADEAADARTWQSTSNAGIGLVRLVLVFGPPAILYLLSDLAGDNSGAIWVDWREKLAMLFQPFFNYDWRLDITTATAVVVVVYVGLIIRAGTLSRPAGIAFLVAMLLFVVAPKAFKGGTYFDNRFLLFAMFLLFACFVPKRAPSVLAAVAGSVIGVLFIVRMLFLAFAWHGHAADVSELRQTISTVEPGSRVLVVTVGPQSAPQYWAERKWRAGMIDGFRPTDSHMAALLVIERKAFWPLLFSVPNQHPIVVLPPYREISVRSGELPEYSLLAKDRLSEVEARFFPYLAEWATRFDYVLLLNSGAAPELAHFLPEKLQPVDATRMAALFRIRR